jgi:hypothetical protein
MGLAGQMHGQVIMDDRGQVVGSVRLRCDARNEEEGLTKTPECGQMLPYASTIGTRLRRRKFSWGAAVLADIGTIVSLLLLPVRTSTEPPILEQMAIGGYTIVLRFLRCPVECLSPISFPYPSTRKSTKSINDCWPCSPISKRQYPPLPPNIRKVCIKG